MHKKRVKRDILFQIVNGIFFILFAVICFYPFYYIIIYSISDPNKAMYAFLLPIDFTLESYVKIFSMDEIFTGFKISTLRTIAGTTLTVLFSSFLAYLVSKREMTARKFVYRFIIVTMYLNAGIIPWYLTMKVYGLKNNFLLYILPGSISAYFIILIKTYIESLPAEIEESAQLDGAGYLTRFFRLVLPLCKPIIATVSIYSAVGQWNSWSDNYFLVSDKKLQTLQLILYNYLHTATRFATASTKEIEIMGNATGTMTPMTIKMTVTVITTLPIMLVYPIMQKHFAKGIMMGAIKG